MSLGYLQIIWQLLRKVVVHGGEQQVIRWPSRVEAGRTTFPGDDSGHSENDERGLDTVSLRFLKDCVTTKSKTTLSQWLNLFLKTTLCLP